jgi:hypothetical protein
LRRTGADTQYATLDDAKSGTSPLSTSSVGQRDPSISFVDNNPDAGDNFDTTLTAWYYSIHGPHPGGGNPSNQNEGFVQIYDDGHSTVTGFSSGFTDPALTSYRLQVAGANAVGANPMARLGPQGSNAYAGTTTAGTFFSNNLDASFSNLNPAGSITCKNAYESDGDPAGVSVSGTFSGTFRNVGGDPGRPV